MYIHAKNDQWEIMITMKERSYISGIYYPVDIGCVHMRTNHVPKGS